eukprot:760865-Hanusia_phi.AAC.2
MLVKGMRLDAGDESNKISRKRNHVGNEPSVSALPFLSCGLDSLVDTEIISGGLKECMNEKLLREFSDLPRKALSSRDTTNRRIQSSMGVDGEWEYVETTPPKRYRRLDYNRALSMDIFA